MPARIERYGRARSRALTQLNFIKSCAKSADVLDRDRLDSLILRIQNCGNFLIFRNYYTVNQIKLTSASFCKSHLLCPLCAIRRASKFLQAYLERLEIIQESHPHLQPYLVTLTIKNGDDLAERFEHLHCSIRNYLKRRRKS
ncbi:protein rep, partial [Picosynechococcus sp. NKBG042902]|uniref:protein rep n=1 Tax=Picosynechococcus sp. NKBG042902 TaxID=490193 RepID=UPI00137884B3